MRSSVLRVVTYHRVLDRSDASRCSPSLVSATPAAFEREMQWLARRYRVVSASEVIDAFHDGRTLPRRAVLITFDDGYRDFGDIAWPILHRYGLPATLFVATAYPDHPERRFWWDRLFAATNATRRPCLEVPECRAVLRLQTAEDRRASLRMLHAVVKALPHADAMHLVDRVCDELGLAEPMAPVVLTWHELRALASDGVAIAAHTRTHPALTRLPLDRARAEIRASREDLTRELGMALPLFAYPFGDHDDRVEELVRDEGFALAVTTEYGHNRWPAAAPLRLRRTHISSAVTPLLFRARLTMLGGYVDSWRHIPRQRSRSASTSGSDPNGPARKVAYIMSRFPKLSETFVLNEIATAADAGVPIEVYPLLRVRTRATHPEAAVWVRRAHFHRFVSVPVCRANAHFLLQQPATYLRVWAEVLRKTWGSPNFFIGALGILPKSVRFAYEIERDGVTHVHAHFATHPTVAALVIHRLTGIPFSFTAHGSDLHVDRRMLDAKLAAAAFAVTVSNFNKNVMVETCGQEVADKIRVIRCGVDLDVFSPRHGIRDAGPFRIICVASLETVKGHAYLIEACLLLRLRGLDFRCDLVGDGPRRRDIETQISRSGLDRHVYLHGAQPRPEVLRRLSIADAAVLASHPTREGKREGIPVSLMEAMASELPVVASAISGIPELVQQNVTGLLVPSGNPTAIADALERLAGDPALRRELGVAARNEVRARFNLRTNTAQLIALFSAREQVAPDERLPVSAPVASMN
jgi:glycosyltransferase involved in cell wall biosynthesis/peptidoglycan/xylan/chitin deacetylase (PgdA/CDA1 family)